jgi:hypothetical protein
MCRNEWGCLAWRGHCIVRRKVWQAVQRGKLTLETIKTFAVVALLEDLPERGLRRGQVGTVVEPLAPGIFEVEFSDNDGHTYATLALRTDQLMVLHHNMAEVA